MALQASSSAQERARERETGQGPFFFFLVVAGRGGRNLLLRFSPRSYSSSPKIQFSRSAPPPSTPAPRRSLLFALGPRPPPGICGGEKKKELLSQQHEWRTWEGSGRNSGILLDAIVHGPPSPSLPLSRLLVCSRATHLPASPVLRTSRLLRHPREGLLPLRPSPGGPGHDARASRPHTHGATHASLAHSPPAAAAACSATFALFYLH